MEQYLVREAFEPVARKRRRSAARQAAIRARRGQLSVLIDRDVLDRWRDYVRDRQEGEEPLSGAEILEDLLDRTLRRKGR